MTAELLPGSLLAGKYRIVAAIGQGGMGTIHAAEHVAIGRRVAIKTLHAHVAAEREHLARFELEATAASRIGSPHIVDVLDFGETERGERFLVMELLEGESLRERLQRRGRVPPGEILTIVLELLTGLEHAHAAGIVHRDLKPANVFLMRASHHHHADFVKILDFGVSKFKLRGGAPATASGMILGTPRFMAPEQLRGETVDARSDIYAVGAILFLALCGRYPFEATRSRSSSCASRSRIPRACARSRRRPIRRFPASCNVR